MAIPAVLGLLSLWLSDRGHLLCSRAPPGGTSFTLTKTDSTPKGPLPPVFSGIVGESRN